MYPIANPDKKRSGITLYMILLFLFSGIFNGNLKAEQKIVISLDEAVKIALKNYPEFKQSANSVSLADIDVRSRKSNFLPDLNAVSSYSKRRAKSPDPVNGEYTALNSDSLNFTISSNFNIFNGFFDLYQLKKAELSRESANENHLRFKQDVAFLTLQKFTNTLIAKEFINVEMENLEAQTLMLEKINDFFESGKKPITDLYQQKADISRSRLNLMDAKQSYITAKLDLNRILGINDINNFTLMKPDIPDSEKADGSNNKNSILNRALKLRKDLVAQLKRVEASDKNISAAKSGYWPKLSLFANLSSGYSGLDNQYSYSEQLFKNNPAYSAGLTLSIPIFNKNSVRNSIATAKIQYENDKLEIEKLNRKIANEVREAIENYKTAIGQIKAAESQVKYSKAALQSIQDRYNVNASTITELTQARAKYKQAGFDLIKAKYNLLTREAAVYYYSGNGKKLFSLLKGENKGEKNE